MLSKHEEQSIEYTYKILINAVKELEERFPELISKK